MSWTERRGHVTQYRQARIQAAPDSKERARLDKKYRLTEAFIHLRLRNAANFWRTPSIWSGTTRVSGSSVRPSARPIPACSRASGNQSSRPSSRSYRASTPIFRCAIAGNWKKRPMRPGIMAYCYSIRTGDASEATLAQQFQGFRRRGHSWGQLRHVIEIPFFASSEDLPGLQLADICSYAVRRYLDRDAVVGSHEERNFQRIFHRFDQDGRGRLHGLRHFIQAGLAPA